MPHPDDVHRCTIELQKLDDGQWRALVYLFESVGSGNRRTPQYEDYPTREVAKRAAEKFVTQQGFEADKLDWDENHAIGEKSEL